ncbi:UDP-N-acetylmuramoyl-tripeptide--D-alanyl-D-alanine ligase [Gordonia rubripertincta]|uniref:UDP-N-acetylmuramoyl-tripeptide--D-alanyl-D-alanine ligase n=1 Tax=Gordonia rubripertincta TaxID=36822 RepID=A0ABT4MQ19_GORRU|nr:UDP-N-acetylmuramoyl-tripeptide--D-alanyl-D-alanine ligase [Gordonia rubripertincta]MCZ4549095.1 UDP-N-acetylmuramoyl-tripeptide--D-alanyl-D-alanine ligase [Gordonia rubripertincta]
MTPQTRLTLSDGRTAGDLLPQPPGAVTVRSVRSALRELADVVHAQPERRSWAILGELDPPDDLDVHDALEMTRWVVSHDELGRLAVRLDIAQVICVGTSRAMHGLHQGAVMEGSWGSEAVLVSGPKEALDILDAQLGQDDVVLVMGGRELGLAEAIVAGGVSKGEDF